MDQFAQRRAQFAEAIGDGVAIIPAGRDLTRNDDVNHEFRQDSTFYFLTGFPEPDAVAVIHPSHPSAPYTLFVRPRDREMEIWNGYRAGTEGAKSRFGADAAFPVDDLSEQLKEHLIGCDTVYYRTGSPLDATLLPMMDSLRPLAARYGRTIPTRLIDPSPILDDLRLRKSEPELAHLRRACDISVLGHEAAMRFTKPGVYEYQVQAAMEQVFRQEGSPRNGYPSIVASGPNACILHYTENDRQVEDGDLLLIDAAAESGHFSSDITRTFPANGRFSATQRAVYDVVLAAQRASIAVATAGNTHRDMDETAKRVVTEGLVDLGLLPRGLEDSLSMHHYRQYFMHGTGHWLGMDVHDAGSVQIGDESRTLEVGMSFTVEPGIYVAPDQETVEFVLMEGLHPAVIYERRFRMGWDAARKLEQEETKDAPRVTHEIPAEFRGIGIRIEDDIAITAAGSENLTSALPVDPDEIEAFCQS
ncbi:MAG: aminopeptidase P N-terminal domain-containing protein [Acidimicrobiia bacterium]|nr:aminopeptidase P N-terminal domain-containing protein [Acidimicrobiia bacterium]MDH5503514.1 aminopeptidase P N-terminal domain-containing protein [Acidimicrobiia bacterium]